jgi:mevalonate kinase
MSATSFGKVILSGEHSAVYGEPAVAASVNLQIRAQLTENNSQSAQDPFFPFIKNLLSLFQEKYNKDTSHLFVKFDGDLPIGSGLGSSAAAAHAILLELSNHFNIPLSDDELIALTQESERFAHGHPSGLDVITVIKRGVIQFQRQGEKLNFSALPTAQIQAVPFVLIQSGKPEESTKRMIEIVAEKQKTPQGKDVISQIGKLTSQLISDIKSEAFSFEWIKENNRYLEELGVVSAKAHSIIEEVGKIGGYAKVTGAGGQSDGSGMILTYLSDTEKLHAFLDEKKWEFFSVDLGK